jgi:hypothetical protein
MCSTFPQIYIVQGKGCLEQHSDEKKNIAEFAESVLQDFISKIQSGSIDFPSSLGLQSMFSLEKDINSGLTEKSGLYAIVNKKNNRIYLGSTGNLAQRKGEHNYNFSDTTGLKRVSETMRSDLKNGFSSDFIFVPLLIIEQGSVTSKEKALELVKHAEESLLTKFLSAQPNIFYNVKTMGPFTPGNKFGGSPDSGSPKKSVCYKTMINNEKRMYIWESVSGASRTFQCVTKSIRVKIEQNKMFYFNENALSNSSHVVIRISDDLAETFFSDQMGVYNQMLSELFPNKKSKKM